ncbi:iron-containing redox enzyme family protein [Nocardia iowensis]|uniref:Iron-containing redox enzyme family protein n=1 Tax=Nocardia iowensis TaxID=204891 RepID=A0ABX8RU14_NOCIO|nr:iron-containing redox enzyme family protein [Nocardia iowensis]QXN93130.1 iron-containing redox enzyme family protein [Nocardia iowensis]
MAVSTSESSSNAARRWEPRLPRPRGPITEMLLKTLVGGPGNLSDVAIPTGNPLSDDDLHLALYLCYELHYRGFAGVDPRWEWHPGLLALRGQLEAPFEAALRERFLDDTCRGNPDVRAALTEIADRPGPSLSRYLRDNATAEQFREAMVLRSAYRLKEADPHSFAIPRLENKAKAALVEIEYDEFGSGRPDRIHAVLYRTSMAAIGLDARYGAYLDAIPGIALATVNLMSLFGLHRRLRGAAVGHLTIAEMTSALANKKQGDGLRRLGFDIDVTGFFDEHVLADSVHELIALNDMAGGLAAQEPDLTEDILFGASAATGLDNILAQYVLDRWASGQSALTTVK